MKRIFAVFLILLLFLSACGKKTAPAETAAGGETRMPGASAANAGNETKPPGLAYLSESVQAFIMAAGDDYNTIWEYVIQGRSSDHFRECFAGMEQPDMRDVDNGSKALTVFFIDPEDKACLDELAALGLATDYEVKKGIGTQNYLAQCKKEIQEKLGAVQQRVKDGSASDEEKELITVYRPADPVICWNFGKLSIDVQIRTPWYIVEGETWTEKDMMQDFERCVELFGRVIGEYEVLMFGFPV